MTPRKSIGTTGVLEPTGTIGVAFDGGVSTRVCVGTWLLKFGEEQKMGEVSVMGLGYMRRIVSKVNPVYAVSCVHYRNYMSQHDIYASGVQGAFCVVAL